MGHYFTNDENLKSDFKSIHFKISDIDFDFTSDMGVFSKDKIDYGTRLLIETYLSDNFDSKTILDVGCGYGPIGISLAKLTHSKVTCIDVNKRAIHLTKMNAKKNGVDIDCFESDKYLNVSGVFDIVITNPPIRAGKEVLKDILLGSFEHLTNDGQLWFVMRKNHGVKSMIEYLTAYCLVSIKKRSNGFYIVCCTKKY